MVKKVLIYGEYSGFGKSLASGFNKIGIEASVFSIHGDSWKKIKTDITLGECNAVIKLITLITLIPRFLSYDTIVIMNPRFFSIKMLGPIMLGLFKLFKKKIILLCCGDDYQYIKYWEGKNELWPYYKESYPRGKYCKTISDKLSFYLCGKSSDIIIPTMFDYSIAWRNSIFKNKVSKTIPLACDGDINKKIKLVDKIVISHGINREGFKGSDMITAALKKIKDENENIEIIYPTRLSFDSYIKLLDTIDISIDQCKCHGYGMNAIYSMLAGCVTLAPASNEFLNDLGINESPIKQIKYDDSDIYNVLNDLILDKKRLLEQKYKTQKYAIKIHSPEVVASQIILELNKKI